VYSNLTLLKLLVRAKAVRAVRGSLPVALEAPSPGILAGGAYAYPGTSETQRFQRLVSARGVVHWGTGLCDSERRLLEGMPCPVPDPVLTGNEVQIRHGFRQRPAERTPGENRRGVMPVFSLTKASVSGGVVSGAAKSKWVSQGGYRLWGSDGFLGQWVDRVATGLWSVPGWIRSRPGRCDTRWWRAFCIPRSAVPESTRC
jgi:hypothetical protein